MKKVLFSIVMTMSVFLGSISPLLAGSGGDSFIGGLAGATTGSLLGNALTKSSGKSDINEQREIEIRRHEQEKARIQALEYEVALQANGSSMLQGPYLYLLMFFILLLVVGIGVMAIMLTKKPHARSRN